jgi:enterochelin esterase-like enzyme
MKFSITLFLLTSINLAIAQLPVVSSGIIVRLENYQSNYVTARNIDVWLPDGYSPKKKYAVLYMQDGQMLFDSSITWTKVAWDVDDTASKLMKEKKIKDVIVVGIWNAGAERHRDYCPQKPYENLISLQKDFLQKSVRVNGQSVFNNYTVKSDNYLQFLVKELKPYIDKTYSTYTDRANTLIAGSSMGGLISLYAICEYPAIFGGAACFSTHWPVIFSMENNPMPAAIFTYLKNKLPVPKNHKIYFDYGDQTLDAMYPPLQKKVDAVMRAKGFTEINWMTKYFPGENHSEEAWKKRLHIPLLFMLKKSNDKAGN